MIGPQIFIHRFDHVPISEKIFPLSKTKVTGWENQESEKSHDFAYRLLSTF